MVQRSGYLVSQIAQDFEFRVKLLQPNVSPTLVTQHILDWTAGQPFLTYRLYELILQGPLSPKGKHSLEPEQSAFDAEGIWIDTYVRTNLIKYCSDPELIKHLRDICRIMIQDPRSLEMLRLYRRLRRGRTFPADLLDHVQRRLVQSGLAKLEDQELQLSNRFYGEVFNGSWLARAFKTVEARLRDEAVAAINAVFEEQRSPLETQQIPCLPQPQWREQGTVTEATS
ncbi:MAG: hypothetical protein HC824_20645, partial [Synechococcales cyanobacterium RM1_1_8]|nr:hypothetical protein [Synechococcales cyanobacterium RM1_1_8]